MREAEKNNETGRASGSFDLPSVLLVDDRPANLLALEAILDGMPIRTVRANSGQEALRALLRHDYALVLLDVQMPEMDGFETASAIKAHPRTSDLPIIFVTAISRDAANVFKGYQRGAVDYILKPFDPEILKAKVSIFVDLYMKGETIKKQAKRIHDQEMEALERRTEERYRRLADLMPLIMWATRAEGSVYYTNRAWGEYSGLSIDETETITNPLVLHPDDLPGVSASWQAALETKTPFEMQYRVRRSVDGRYRWHLARGVPERDDLGGVEGWVVTATDIDDQKLIEQEREHILERERVARQTAEGANRMKDEFLANVSHELRTPLNAILGWARMLRSGNLDPTRVTRALETIERNANIQTDLIEDLLDVSRIISGQLRLQRTRIELVSVVQAAVETVRPSADTKGVELELVGSASVEEISGDSGRLQQVIWNLVANAVKFTPKGGRVEVHVVRRDSNVEVTVTDTGAGIAPEFLAYVFDRFRQADSASTRAHQGLGLGLAIARHIVELHGGQIVAASPGLSKGATFKVSLPIRLLHVHDGEPEWFGEALGKDPVATFPRLDGLRLVFVDDQADAREVFTSLFEQCGATVTACRTGNEAVTALESGPVHVLVSDIGLPGEDGYALIKRVRSRATDADANANAKRNASVPAIAVSGLARGDNPQRALGAGFQVYLSKPVHPAELVNLVKSLAQAARD